MYDETPVLQVITHVSVYCGCHVCPFWVSCTLTPLSSHFQCVNQELDQLRAQVAQLDTAAERRRVRECEEHEKAVAAMQNTHKAGTVAHFQRHF